MGNIFSNLYQSPIKTREEKTPSNSNITVWLDNTYDRTIPKAENATHLALRKVDPYLVTFRDSQKCSDYITSINADKSRVILIVSEKIPPDSSDNIIKVYENLPQIDGIYILCDSNKAVSQTLQTLQKVKGIFKDAHLLTSALSRLPYLKRKRREDFARQDFIINSLPSVPSDFASSSSSRFIQLLVSSQREKEAEFLYSQLLRDILVDAESSQEEMIQFCRQKCAGFKSDLNVIDEFEDYYDALNAIYWYTRDTFLYRMLNKALRKQDIDTLYSLRYFIRDLHLQLKERHTSQQQTHLLESLPAEIYRGQLMAVDEFDKKIRNQEGGYFSVSSFFSTTLLKERSLLYAGDGSRLRSNNECSVLFEINIDKKMNKFPYANVTDESVFEEEESEVLFTMGAVFRIASVAEERPGFWIVKLSLTGEEHKELLEMGDSFKQLVIVAAPLLSLANVMHALGKYQKSEQYYMMSLQHSRATEDWKTQAFTYYHLGAIYQRTGQLEKALAYHKTSLDIQLRHSISTDTLLSNTYNSLGGIYSTQKDYEKALFHLQRALDIRLQNPNPTDTSVVYNNLGTIYLYQRRYEEALLMYSNAFDAQKVVLPPNHPTFTTTFNNLAMVYGKQKDYNKEVEFLKKSLELLQKSLPAKHPYLTETYFNLALAFFKQGQWKQAFEYWNKTYESNKTSDALRVKERNVRFASTSRKQQLHWLFLYGFLFFSCYFFLRYWRVSPVIIGFLLFVIWKLEFIDFALTFITGI